MCCFNLAFGACGTNTRFGSGGVCERRVVIRCIDTPQTLPSRTGMGQIYFAAQCGECGDVNLFSQNGGAGDVLDGVTNSSTRRYLFITCCNCDIDLPY